MRTAPAAVALALLCSPLAVAQTAGSVTVRLVHDDADSVISVGESVTWTLWVELEGYAPNSA